MGKMVNNMLLWASILANHAGMQFVRSIGVDVSALRGGTRRT
ncbi:MAG: hypothetical protein ACRER4_01780 [Steroidobacteraceae bacterium]